MIFDIDKWQKSLYQLGYIKQIRRIVDGFICKERFYELVRRYEYFEHDDEHGTVEVSKKINQMRQRKFDKTLQSKIDKCDYELLIKTIEKHKEGLYERLVKYVEDNKINKCLLTEYQDRLRD
ncbi:Hypothetical_protein [Hexamita inflata]|uniref:Hypothetical_protein n=1 Tax=Hexamita inflata TaxID=28002 RepID=A0AA86NGB1_9EUKA|nr:Hypothetical protein HINF_LOCUS6742 [Hexamita inflata]